MNGLYFHICTWTLGPTYLAVSLIPDEKRKVVGRHTTPSPEVAGNTFTYWFVSIWRFPFLLCHLCAFAPAHLFCSFHHLFVLCDSLLHVFGRPVKNDWLHWYVKADFIFLWWQRECSAEQRPRAWATSHFLPTQFKSLAIYDLSQENL